jgi:hypothetical protein
MWPVSFDHRNHRVIAQPLGDYCILQIVRKITIPNKTIGYQITRTKRLTDGRNACECQGGTRLTVEANTAVLRLNKEGRQAARRSHNTCLWKSFIQIRPPWTQITQEARNTFAWPVKRAKEERSNVTEHFPADSANDQVYHVSKALEKRAPSMSREQSIRNFAVA